MRFDTTQLGAALRDMSLREVAVFVIDEFGISISPAARLKLDRMVTDADLRMQTQGADPSARLTASVRLFIFILTAAVGDAELLARIEMSGHERLDDEPAILRLRMDTTRVLNLARESARRSGAHPIMVTDLERVSDALCPGFWPFC